MTTHNHDRSIDKAFILDPDGWPTWPVCPLKRTRTSMAVYEAQAGILLSGGTTVYLVNMFDRAAMNSLHDQQCIEYTNVDALLADGWQVD